MKVLVKKSKLHKFLVQCPPSCVDSHITPYVSSFWPMNLVCLANQYIASC